MLNVAKMVDFARRGADGIVNAVCFNCMLGTVSIAVTGRIREDHEGVPDREPRLLGGRGQPTGDAGGVPASGEDVHEAAIRGRVAGGAKTPPR